MHSTKTIRIAVLAIICLIGIASVVAYMWYTLEQKGAALLSSMQATADAQARELRYADLEDSVGAIVADEAAMRKFILNGERDTVTFLSTVDDLAAGLGVVLTTERLEVRTEEGRPFDSLDISFKIEGSESAVMQLIALLETIPYHSFVRSVEVQKSVNELTGVVSIESTLTLTVTIDQTQS